MFVEGLPSASPVIAADPVGDLRHASATIQGYMQDVSNANYQSAWAALARGSQATFGSQSQFASDWRALMESSAREYRIGIVKHDLALLRAWISPGDPNYPALDRAYIVEVRYPKLAPPGNFNVLVAAPSNSGWAIWQVS